MDKAALVSVDVEAGAQLLGIADRAGLGISVALWACFSEFEDWRFVLSGRQLDAVKLRRAYRLLHDSFEQAGFPFEKLPPVMILPMSDPFIKNLRRTFGKSPSVEGMRLGGQMIGDRFVLDAYVYRIS